MPNHITSHISFLGDPQSAAEFFAAIQNDADGPNTIDFNKIIPMPPELNIEAGSRTDRGLQLYGEYLKESADLVFTHFYSHETEEQYLKKAEKLLEKYSMEETEDPGLFALGEKCYTNIQKYGAPTWYEWCIQNWGTKWNAYDFDEPSQRAINSCRFQTAWDAPHPVMEKLSGLYPDASFTHRWADENIGFNCGECEYADGEIISEYIPAEGSKEAYEFSADVLRCDLSEYGLRLSADGSTYEYREESELDMQEPEM